MNVHPTASTYTDPKDLLAEQTRVFDVCASCRRCFNLCPSFPTLFDYIDEEADFEAKGLTREHIHTVTDLCFSCQLCWNHCPYTPPHEWEIDFPGLMTRAKVVQKTRWSWKSRLLANIELIGKVGSLSRALTNWANTNPITRRTLQIFIGIDRRAILPVITKESFTNWFSKRPTLEKTSKRVSLFYTCVGNYFASEIAKDTVKVLNHNDIGVEVPDQVCCGMPYLDLGDLDTVKRKATRNIKSLLKDAKKGNPIIVPNPSCSLMIKQEYPKLFNDEDSRIVSANTYDICEYLTSLRKNKELKTDFPGDINGKSITYHVPCHLRSQNIGFPAKELLELIPETTVNSIEQCSGHNGNWGVLKVYFEKSMNVGKKLFQEIDDSQSDIVVSDCSLAGDHIKAATKRSTVHPITVLSDAYNLDKES